MPSNSDSPITRGDRRAISLVAWLSLGALALTIVWTIWQLVNGVFARTIPVHVPIADDAVFFEDGLKQVPSSIFTEAEVTVVGAPWSVRVPLALGVLLSASSALAICVLIFILGRRFASHRPLLPGTATVALVAALLSFAAALLTPLLRGLAAAAATEALGLHNFGFAILMFEFPAGALVTPTLLFLLAAALTIGARLQRDTEGLV